MLSGQTQRTGLLLTVAMSGSHSFNPRVPTVCYSSSWFCWSAHWLKLAFLLPLLETVGPPSLSSLVYWIYLGLAVMQSCSLNKEITPNWDMWQLVSLCGCLGSDQKSWPTFRRCQLLRSGYCENADNKRESSVGKPFSKITSWPKETGPVLLLLLICLYDESNREPVCRTSPHLAYISLFPLGLEGKTLLSKKEKMKLRKERWLQSKHWCIGGHLRGWLLDSSVCRWKGCAVAGQQLGRGGWMLLKSLQACSPASGEKSPWCFFSWIQRAFNTKIDSLPKPVFVIPPRAIWLLKTFHLSRKDIVPV